MRLVDRYDGRLPVTLQEGEHISRRAGPKVLRRPISICLGNRYQITEFLPDLYQMAPLHPKRESFIRP
jgi:hypothetical protein